MAVGIHSGKSQHHTKMKKVWRRDDHGLGDQGIHLTKCHKEDVHHYHTGQIKKIKLKGANGALYGSAQPIKEIKEQNGVSSVIYVQG